MHRSPLLSFLRRASLFREGLVSLVIGLLLLPVQAESPAWWAQRGLVLSGGSADDYAVLNQGQLKNLVRAATEEMEARLPGSAGSVLTSLVTGWRASASNADDYAAVNIGQLKAAAKPVYERLLAVGHISALPAWATATGGAGDDDYAAANIGQAKNLFAFDLSGINTAPLVMRALGPLQAVDASGFAVISARLTRNDQPVGGIPVTFEVVNSAGLLFTGPTLPPLPAVTVVSYSTGSAMCIFEAPPEGSWCWIRASAASVTPEWFAVKVGDGGGSSSVPAPPAGPGHFDPSSGTPGSAPTGVILVRSKTRRAKANCLSYGVFQAEQPFGRNMTVYQKLRWEEERKESVIRDESTSEHTVTSLDDPSHLRTGFIDITEETSESGTYIYSSLIQETKTLTHAMQVWPVPDGSRVPVEETATAIRDVSVSYVGNSSFFTRIQKQDYYDGQFFSHFDSDNTDSGTSAIIQTVSAYDQTDGIVNFLPLQLMGTEIKTADEQHFGTWTKTAKHIDGSITTTGGSHNDPVSRNDEPRDITEVSKPIVSFENNPEETSESTLSPTLSVDKWDINRGGGKALESWKRTKELSNPVSWESVDAAMRAHMATQSWPSWPSSFVDTGFKVATYQCDFNPHTPADSDEDAFSSESTEVCWQLKYAIPAILTEAERAALPPRTLLARKTYKDPQGKTVEVQFVSVTLEPGAESPEYITKANEANGPSPILPKGGTVTMDLLPVEVMQTPLANDGYSVQGGLTNTSTFRLARWQDAWDANWITKNDFIAADRDRVTVRIPSNAFPNLTAGSKPTVKVTCAGDTTTLDMNLSGGNYVSEPFLFVADADDDESYNGKAGFPGTNTDGHLNDQTISAAPGQEVTIEFENTGGSNIGPLAVGRIAQPTHTISCELVVITQDGNVSAADIQDVDDRFQMAAETYAQVGVQLQKVGAVTGIATPVEYWNAIVNGTIAYDTPRVVNGQTEWFSGWIRSKSPTVGKVLRVLFVRADSLPNYPVNSANGTTMTVAGFQDLKVALVCADQNNQWHITLAHEIGHYVGLGHPSGARNLMSIPARAYSRDWLDSKRFRFEDEKLLKDYMKANGF